MPSESDDMETCHYCELPVERSAAVKWVRRLAPLDVAYGHDDCYDPWADSTGYGAWNLATVEDWI